MVAVYLTWTLPLSRRPLNPIKSVAGKAEGEEIEVEGEEIEAEGEEGEA